MRIDDVRNIAVVGAGIMGHGIAQTFATAGYQVTLTDADLSTLEAATPRIARNLASFVEYELVPESEVPGILSRITTVPELREAVADADVVVEAIVEDFDSKRTLFNTLDGLCLERTILASNSSSLLISEFAAQTNRQDRVILTHWFNPPHIVPTVEIIPGHHTSDETYELIFSLHERIGKLAIRIRKELPGYLVNRIQMAMLREVWSLWEQGVAAPEDIDRAVRGSFGFRLASIGPLMTNDLGGNDTNYRVASYLLPLINSAVQPPKAFADMVTAGGYGQKSGWGFYKHSPEEWRSVIEKRDREFLQRLKALYRPGSQEAGKP